MRLPITCCVLATAFAALLPATPFASALDNHVEGGGVSHVPWQDRAPLCPRANEAFTIRFQAFRGDLSSANVLFTAGATPYTLPAAVVGARGPYDLWQATTPNPGATTASYTIQLIDGSDTEYLSVGGVSATPPVDGGFALDFTTYAHTPLGATYRAGSTSFKVWSPATTSARVRGAFDGWGAGVPMTRAGEYWTAIVPNVADRSEYKYYFNNLTWNTDPRARGLDAANGPYNAIVENPARYAWRVSDFPTPALESMVVYQLHVGTFCGRNDPLGAAAAPNTYLDVAKRVGHLQELGVNAVMLNPVTEFQGDESAGYNPITQWAPEWKYGTPDQFKALVDSLHTHGIAVILDIVWNHFSSGDNFLWNYDGTQLWFDTPQVDTPWGSQADFDKLPVRDYFADAALLWLEEYKLDGFRMDATGYMTSPGQAASGWGLMQRFNDEIDRRWVNKLAIAEQLPSDPAVTKPTDLGGAGFDAQYDGGFRDNLRAAVLNGVSGDPNMSALAGSLQGGGVYFSGRRAFHYFQLHDEAWPSSGGQRLVKTIDGVAPYDNAAAQGRMKLALGVTLLAPGVPAMLMGDEWLEDVDFGSGSGNRIDWSKQATYAPYVACIRRLIELRRTNDAFAADRTINVLHVNEGGNVLGFTRTDAHGNPYLVMANFGNTNYPVYRIGAPRSGGWTQLVNTQAAVYGGSGLDNGALATEAVAYDGQPQSLVVSLPAASVMVFAPNLLLDVPAPVIARGDRIVRLAPVPVRGAASVEFSLAAAGEARVEVVDVGGRLVSRLAGGAFAAGSHRVRWEGRDLRGQRAAAGVYFVRLVTPRGSDVRRLPLLW